MTLIFFLKNNDWQVDVNALILKSMKQMTPSFFGITHSNRNFQLPDAWGKNQFNSSFPASLLCYMASKELKAKYLKSKKYSLSIGEISFKEIVGNNWNSGKNYFSFETVYAPYAKYMSDQLPRVDLVIEDCVSKKQLAPLEVKLTAIPDNTTCDLSEDKYGSELVIRPDTIVYLALSFIHNQKKSLKDIKSLMKKYSVETIDFNSEAEVLSNFSNLASLIKALAEIFEVAQKPLIMQPIWKTIGKTPALADHCLDMFIWSDVAFMKFNLSLCRVTGNTRRINRQMRSIVWLIKMLYDYCENDCFSGEEITNKFIYGSRNDKAFAVSGFVTNSYMSCPELEKPRITKEEIKNIILGGGEKMLSPERRFDAIVFNLQDLFSK